MAARFADSFSSWRTSGSFPVLSYDESGCHRRGDQVFVWTDVLSSFGETPRCGIAGL